MLRPAESVARAGARSVAGAGVCKGYRRMQATQALAAHAIQIPCPVDVMTLSSRLLATRLPGYLPNMPTHLFILLPGFLPCRCLIPFTSHTRSLSSAACWCSYHEYPQRSSTDTLLVLMIESPEAIENIAEMSALEGFDMLIIGPRDMATSG